MLMLLVMSMLVFLEDSRACQRMTGTRPPVSHKCTVVCAAEDPRPLQWSPWLPAWHLQAPLPRLVDVVGERQLSCFPSWRSGHFWNGRLRPATGREFATQLVIARLLFCLTLLPLNIITTHSDNFWFPPPVPTRKGQSLPGAMCR